jgi:hypothetical protein
MDYFKNFKQNREYFALVNYAEFLEVKTEINDGVIFRSYLFQTNIGKYKNSFEITNDHFNSMNDKDLAEFDKKKIELLKTKFQLKEIIRKDA